MYATSQYGIVTSLLQPVFLGGVATGAGKVEKFFIGSLFNE